MNGVKGGKNKMKKVIVVPPLSYQINDKKE
jgi:hypothetical protein